MKKLNIKTALTLVLMLFIFKITYFLALKIRSLMALFIVLEPFERP